MRTITLSRETLQPQPSILTENGFVRLGEERAGDFNYGLVRLERIPVVGIPATESRTAITEARVASINYGDDHFLESCVSPNQNVFLVRLTTDMVQHQERILDQIAEVLLSKNETSPITQAIAFGYAPIRQQQVGEFSPVKHLPVRTVDVLIVLPYGTTLTVQRIDRKGIHAASFRFEAPTNGEFGGFTQIHDVDLERLERAARLLADKHRTFEWVKE